MANIDRFDSFDDYDNSNIDDPWQSYLGGIRIDHNGSRDSYTVEAQGYNDHRSDQYTDDPFDNPAVFVSRKRQLRCQTTTTRLADGRTHFPKTLT
jgi:hypothetical protein